MKRTSHIRYSFVDYIPANLEEGVLYISIEFRIASHKCACGCGKEVVTPFSPTDWALIYDGESISLNPSIGNWGFECQSHYWIKQNQVVWAAQWSQEAIDTNRVRDRVNKETYFEKQSTRNTVGSNSKLENNKESIWQKIKRWLS